MRIIVGLLKSLLVVLVLGLAAVFILTRFFGMNLELDGTGMTPIVSFQDDEAHYDSIEEDRARAAAILAEETPETADVADETPVESPEVDAAEVPVHEAEPVSPVAAPWPAYRGPNGDGIYAQTPINTSWPSDGLPELWRQRVGGGYASMVVADGLVYTIEQRRGNEVVAAYRFDSGLQQWENSWPTLFSESMGGDGPRATPVWDSGTLYALGASGELRALDGRSGEVRWRTNILEDAGASNLQWGMSGSPLVADDKVFVFPGGRDGKSVVAYNAADGSIAWTSQSDKGGYVAPQLATLAGKEQLLYLSGTRIMGLDLVDGTLLWEHPWRANNDINSSQPLQAGDDLLWASSAYGHGAELLKIVPEGNGYDVEVVWAKNTMRNKFNSSVLHEGYVYGLDNGIMACVDVQTGDRMWKGGRYGYGQLLLADGHVIVLTESGEVVLVNANPQGHEEVAAFSALEGKTWNVPAIADGVLLVRNQTEMAAYDLSL